MLQQVTRIAAKLREVAQIMEEDPLPITTPWVNRVSEMPINHDPANGLFIENFGHGAFWPLRAMNQITGLTIHHAMSHSPLGTANYCTSNTHGKGYPTINYHYWVAADDDCSLYQLADPEWALWHDHTGKHQTTLSIAMAGSLHLHRPPQEQIQATVHLCRHLMSLLNIEIDQVTGHRERYRMRTQCPGWGQPDDPVSAGTGWKDDFFSALHAA